MIKWQPVGGHNNPAKTRGLQRLTGPNVPFEIIADYSAVPNQKSDGLTNENPGATAIASGAKDVVQGVYSCGEYIAAFPILAMHWGALV